MRVKNSKKFREGIYINEYPEKFKQKEWTKKKLVPKIYRDAAKLLKKVNEGVGLKKSLYQINHPNLRGIYALACKTIQNNQLLECVIEKTGLLNEKFDPNLAKILVTELLWGKQTIQGNSPPVQITLKFEKALRKAAEKAHIPVDLTEEPLPRYVRINTLKVTINGTIQRLIDDGWQLIDTPETYESFLECVSNLKETEFMRDYHFDDVLVFHRKSNVHEIMLAENGSLLLQDKASCLPAHLLDPKPGCIVLDMCAAPGMKTTHLANLMENKGTIFAVDKNSKRFEEMNKIVERNCNKHNCVTMKLADSVHLTSEDCPGVQYILIDPSCSGSGMASRISERRDGIASDRIQSLSNFQERLLVRALTAFPDVERIVYSTCSFLEEENEKVVERALSWEPSFQVVSPQLKKPWEHRGNLEYPFGSDCLVADIDKDRTNGFFVAVLERIPGTSPSEKTKSKKRKSVTTAETNNSVECQVPKKKKKVKKIKPMEVDHNEDDPE